MWDRMRYGWTWQRGFYLVAGLIMSIIAVMQQEWIVLVFGTYFASMGLFRFGCAGGQCDTGSCYGRNDERKSI